MPATVSLVVALLRNVVAPRIVRILPVVPVPYLVLDPILSSVVAVVVGL
jgi:hypothetical protein